jgi:hypothetical protein
LIARCLIQIQKSSEQDGQDQDAENSVLADAGCKVLLAFSCALASRFEGCVWVLYP